MGVESFLDTIERSDLIDVEHLYSLVPAAVIAGSAWLDVYFVTSLFSSLDSNSLLILLAETSVNGLVGGFVSLFAYSGGKRSFIVGESMQTKESAMATVVGVIIAVGFGAEIIGPIILEQLEWVFIQSFALIAILSLVYTHQIVDSWRIDNEMPHILGLGVLLIAPYL